MNKTEGFITENCDNFQIQNNLFTYDESEKQEHEINKLNAGLILNPQFIPLNPRMLQEGYTFVEACIYGFLQFFLSNNEKFYCTNEQIARMLNVNEKTISLAITKLKDSGLITLSYKIKGGGGRIRYIHLGDDITKSNFRKLQKVMTNITKSNDIYNKIIENKNIIINNTEPSSDFQNQTNSLSLDNSTPKEKEKSSAKKEKEKNPEIDYLIGQIKSICDGMGIAYDKTMDRQFAKHILTAKEYGEFCEKIGQKRIDFALNVLIASIKGNYWKGPMSGPKKIYQNYADVYNQTKQKAQKTITPTFQVL